jgi:hypothetical protein
MGWGLVALGVTVTAAAWVVVGRGRSIWWVMPPVHAVLGAIGVLAADTSVGSDLVAAFAWGVLSGWGLFLATRLAVPILGLSPAFARQVGAQYEPSRRAGLVAASALSLVVLTGEELFWRSGVLRSLDMGVAPASLLVWTAYVAGSLASRSLPIIAAAIVGGAVWGAAAWATGGVAAPLLSHAIWTTLMLVLPPALARGKMEP